MNNLFKMRADIIRISSAPGTVVSVPSMPGKEITIPVSELPSFLVQDDHLSKSWEQIKPFQLAGFGVIVNTFVDLELPYCEEFSRVDARRAYFVGPLAQPSCSTVHRGGDKRAGEAETAVPAVAIARAVAGFMERGAQRDGVEASARDLAGRARAAVGENGSSWRDIHRLIDDLVQARASGFRKSAPSKLSFVFAQNSAVVVIIRLEKK
ncbi:hypothetical protein C2845_PM02G05040 [Panicum miliaceum]|uniref:Uncharacterized protein n=1 Tax=Panicum miliaceum TaxID=4540 RepID=A0A3L6SCK3_PANMI|nr:hypothetical protein C2845_PM02G05040 [Panicum miliaceum]